MDVLLPTSIVAKQKTLHLVAFLLMPGGASEKAANMMALLLTTGLLPILFEYLMKYERKRQEEDMERQAIAAAEVTLRVRRQLDSRDRPHADEDTGPK